MEYNKKKSGVIEYHSNTYMLTEQKEVIEYGTYVRIYLTNREIIEGYVSMMSASMIGVRGEYEYEIHGICSDNITIPISCIKKVDVYQNHFDRIDFKKFWEIFND